MALREYFDTLKEFRVFRVSKVLKGIVVGFAAVFVAAIIYGSVSFHVFKRYTFLSGYMNCEASREDNKKTERLVLDYLFGRECAL